MDFIASIFSTIVVFFSGLLGQPVTSTSIPTPPPTEEITIQRNSSPSTKQPPKLETTEPGVKDASPILELSTSADGKNVEASEIITITWNSKEATANSAIVLWLINVQHDYNLGLLTSEQPINGSYNWKIPTETVHCIDCIGVEGYPGKGTYKIVAKLYTPKGVSFSGMSQGLKPTYIAGVDSKSFTIGGGTGASCPETSEQVCAVRKGARAGTTYANRCWSDAESATFLHTGRCDASDPRAFIQDIQNNIFVFKSSYKYRDVITSELEYHDLRPGDHVRLTLRQDVDPTVYVTVEQPVGQSRFSLTVPRNIPTRSSGLGYRVYASLYDKEGNLIYESFSPPFQISSQ